MQLRKWLPVGPAEAVTVDKAQPFVGEQSPRIALDGAAHRGIRQSGLAVVRGKRYVGHIWLKGTPGAAVRVALIWGAATGDRQIVSLPHLTNTYASFPFQLATATRQQGCSP